MELTFYFMRGEHLLGRRYITLSHIPRVGDTVTFRELAGTVRKVEWALTSVDQFNAELSRNVEIEVECV